MTNIVEGRELRAQVSIRRAGEEHVRFGFIRARTAQLAREIGLLAHMPAIAAGSEIRRTRAKSLRAAPQVRVNHARAEAKGLERLAEKTCEGEERPRARRRGSANVSLNLPEPVHRGDKRRKNGSCVQSAKHQGAVCAIREETQPAPQLQDRPHPW